MPAGLVPILMLKIQSDEIISAVKQQSMLQGCLGWWQAGRVMNEAMLHKELAIYEMTYGVMRGHVAPGRIRGNPN